MESKNPAIEVADYGTCVIGESAYKDLFPVSGQPIVKLCKKNTGLLVFPNSLGEYFDAIDEDNKSICSITSRSYEEGEWELRAGDILGFVGSGETELTIYSRFTEQKKVKDSKGDDEECGEDFFLHYMVQKVFNINLFDLKHSTSEDRVFDFLLCLFPKYLKDALRQGLYKQYVVNKYNDSNVRGMIDVARHIKKNVPFVGKIAYNVREYSYDNNITQLIRHTIECIRSSRMSGILKQDDDTEAYVSQICAVTPSYKSQDRGKIVSKNLKAPTSPYYLGYIPLQKLCIQILTHKKLKYGNDSDKRIYGLLFVGSWLWEEYINTVLKEDFIHPENKKKKNGYHLFSEVSEKREEGKEEREFQDIYPDFISRDKNRPVVVGDTKYIPLDKQNEYSQNEYSYDNERATSIYYKTVMYMYRFKSKCGILLFPYKKTNGGGPYYYEKERLFVKPNKIIDTEGILWKIGVEIPQGDGEYDYGDFQKDMLVVEGELRDKINDIGKGK